MAGFKQIKCVIVGDGGVGKTCLLISYTTNTFWTDYIPTVFDAYSRNMHVDGQVIKMDFWDTAGQEEYDRLRPLSYRHTNVFLVCFSLTSRSSYKSAGGKWLSEVRHFCPHASLLLVGTKSDLKDDTDVSKSISYAEGLQLKEQMHATHYFECSALNGTGIHEVFDAAARVVLYPKPVRARRRICVIL